MSRDASWIGRSSWTPLVVILLITGAAYRGVWATCPARSVITRR
jgi:hypothetical protein